METNKRAQLLGIREVRGLVVADPISPTGVIGADWAPMVNLRAEDTDPEFWRYAGEASIVNHDYTVRDMFGEFTERIAPGAFDKTLSENPLVMLNYMHNPETTMVTSARAASHPLGGMTLATSPNLTVEARVPKTDVDALRIMPKVMRGDATSMSFAFRVIRQEWNEDYTDRTILEVNLARGDVAVIVTGLGANPAAWGTVRAATHADRALLALRAAAATPMQVSQLAELVSNAIDMTDDAFDVFLAALGIPDPDASEDESETEQLAKVRHGELRDLMARKRAPFLT